MAVVSAAAFLFMGALLIVAMRPGTGQSLVIGTIAVVGAWLAWNKSLQKVRRRKALRPLYHDPGCSLGHGL
jgi:hypothetical protein